MAFAEWQETYSVNIKEFDAHHQELLTLINNLYDNILECKNIIQEQPFIGEALTALKDYSDYHFKAEEELMLKYEYPGYELQKEEHEQFKMYVNQLIEQYEKGTLTLSFPIIDFLKDWLLLHVLKIDKQYGPYLNEKL